MTSRWQGHLISGSTAVSQYYHKNWLQNRPFRYRKAGGVPLNDSFFTQKDKFAGESRSTVENRQFFLPSEGDFHVPRPKPDYFL